MRELRAQGLTGGCHGRCPANSLEHRNTHQHLLDHRVQHAVHRVLDHRQPTPERWILHQDDEDKYRERRADYRPINQVGHHWPSPPLHQPSNHQRLQHQEQRCFRVPPQRYRRQCDEQRRDTSIKWSVKQRDCQVKNTAEQKGRFGKDINLGKVGEKSQESEGESNDKCAGF